jgi:hypothetical protein
MPVISRLHQTGLRMEGKGRFMMVPSGVGFALFSRSVYDKATAVPTYLVRVKFTVWVQREQ